MKKAILSVTTALLLGGGAAGYIVTKNDAPNQTNQTVTAQQNTQKEISYKGIEGKNALEILKQMHTVETKDYAGFGEMVLSIDGIKPDSKHFWSMYVNDTQSSEGAGSYSTKADETITWKLEEIQ